MPSPAKLLASASGASVDPNFRNVTLLLHGDGSNGAQNNTFIDGSTNNFTITRNGNTTQGSFSPYGSRWSNYFNSSNITVAYNSALDISSGDFTIEFWVNSPVQSGGVRGVAFFNGSPSFGSSIGWNFVFHTDGSIIFEFYNGNSAAVSLTTATSACNSSWNHIAVSRSGSTFKLYLNGALQGTGTYSGTCNTNSSWATYAGSVAATNTGNITSAYISDLRIVKGTAVYTSAFTPPIAPLTAISGTSLLTCQSNRFRDASTNNFAITANGNVAALPFSPYAPTAPYSAATNGGSMYFDGSGDYLTTPSNAAFAYGTGDFTWEMWVFPTAANWTTGNYYLMDHGSNGGALVYYQNVIRYYNSTTGTGSVLYTNGGTIPANQWTHVAISRSGGTTSLFVNGALRASASDSYNYGTAAVTVANYGGGGLEFQGYISNVRVVKGTAVYTAAFTPPTAPVTAITNTSLLVNGTNAAIIDSSADNDLETVGNAQISTSVKKFGTGSIAFDGSGDYLVAPSSTAFDLGSGDFTIECWFNANSFAAPFGLISRYAVTAGVSAYGWLIQVRSSTSIRLLRGNDLYFDSTVSTMSTGTWYHVAAVRNGSTFTLYLNGTQVGQATGVSNFTDASSTTLQIGRTHTVTDDMNGYIDDIRITKGVARYTANFTPPTAAFPDQ